MAIACPSILEIWESIWEYHFIYTPFTTNGLWLALTCLRFPQASCRYVRSDQSPLVPEDDLAFKIWDSIDRQSFFVTLLPNCYKKLRKRQMNTVRL
ncbi:hypothetical protein BCR42DRAFT_226572 [Absidia repens]|uniref:Uncharacterized protein n=1 Tax=Absidia repens TaxID=90262 RepID=A0A1X2HDY7_9FUNG|nr:hypothetical protein BCR42DRAFT_226572 [Absidia repens]